MFPRMRTEKGTLVALPDRARVRSGNGNVTMVEEDETSFLSASVSSLL